MVNWVAGQDGLISGYNPTTRKLETNFYHLASPGTVDLNGITRIGYELDDSYSSTTYPNAIWASAPITFTPADMAANPGKKLSVAMFIANANQFPAGKIPTPTEIYNAPTVYTLRGDWFWETINSPVTRTFNMKDSPSGLFNTKYWVLVTPVTATSTNGPWDRTNLKPMANVPLNTIGRAVSLWTNRTPGKPIITSPASGALVVPGATFNLTYTTNDPDGTTPDDAQRSNRDLAGVQIQYAPLPTPDNPSPGWRSLTYYRADTSLWTANVLIGQRNFTGGPTNDYALPILTNLGLTVLCGSDEQRPLHGALPGGDWQIRVRTVDFGHPYPNLVRPFGVAANAGGWFVDNAPDLNLSPWSDPVRVSVPSQVPPPLAISPVSNIAIQEGQTVRLSWNYRNTFQPPYPQAERIVQIRKFGDPDWSTVFGGQTGAAFVDLPPVLDNPPPTPASEYTVDSGFEGGTLGGWVVADPAYGATNGTETITNVTAAVPVSHSGTHHLRLDYAGPSGNPGFWLSKPILAGHGRFTTSLWLGAQPSHAAVFARIGWLDSLGNEIPVYDEEENLASAFIFKPDAGWGDGWVQANLGPVNKPPGAVNVVLYVGAVDGVANFSTGLRLDDVSLIGSDPYNLSDFSLNATTHYEWRVRVRDASGVLSDYSQPAPFWVVEPAGSGGVRPIPDQTVDGATLGCGTHKVEIYRRGGTHRVGELTQVSHVDWSRTRDDISTAQIEISGWDIDCGNLLSKLQTWAYEVVIWRDNGYTVDRVWEGPITLLTYKADKVIIDAKDVMGYAYRRILKQQMNDTGTNTVVQRATQVIQNSLAPDDPNVLAYLTPLPRDDDVKSYRKTPEYSRTAFEEVDDMAANAGLDYTVVGRSILLWGTRHRIGTLPEFKDANFGSPPIVSEYGMSMANRYAVSDGNGVWGEATRLDVSGNDPTYGLVEMLSSTWASDSVSDSGTYTEEDRANVAKSFADSAERSIADRYPPPVVVRVPDNTTLSPETVISIQHLVPGIVIPLRSTSTLRTVAQSQKLDSVKVVEEEGKETISVTLSPFSRDDAVGGEME